MKLLPVSQQARIEVVDSLRGFALLGVLIANIPYANADSSPHQWDSILTFLTHFSIDRKFITIFSILFGFGFYIQMQRSKEKNINFKRYFLIRMGLLFIIGIVHSYGIWNGDILMSYALGGATLLIFYNFSIKRLFILALVFNVLLTGIFFIGNGVLGWQTYNYSHDLRHEYPITLSFSRYMTLNFIMNPWTNFLQDIPITIVFTFGNMLIGLLLGKLNFFVFTAKAKRLSTYFIVLGGTVGLTSSYFYHKFMVGELELGLSLIWLPFALAAGMVLHSMLYISLFIRAYQYMSIKKILNFFNSVGKTALSNYILQSVFYLLIIFHCTHLLQLYGKITMAQTYVLALLLFLLQTLLSYLWLKKHAQGPLEYIWKKISYNMAKFNKVN